MNGDLLLASLELLKTVFEARAAEPEKSHEGGVHGQVSRKIAYENAARDLGKLIEAAEKST